MIVQANIRVLDGKGKASERVFTAHCKGNDSPDRVLVRTAVEQGFHPLQLLNKFIMPV